jgi:hypothetical protein
MKCPIRGAVIGAVAGFVGFFVWNGIHAPLLQDLLDAPWPWVSFALLLAGMSSAVCAVIGFVAGFLWWAWAELVQPKIRR